MRVTSKDQDAAIERLSRNLGVKLTVNEWHRHFSVYTEEPRGSAQEMIASSDTRRDFVDQIHAANRALEVKSDTKQSN